MLEIKIRVVDGVAVADCSGVITYGDEAEQLRHAIKDVLQKTPNVVLDFANVRMLDSNGIGTLVGLAGSAQAAGGNLKIAAISPRIQDALYVAKLTTLFKIYGSVAEALEAFRLANTPVAVGELGR